MADALEPASAVPREVAPSADSELEAELREIGLGADLVALIMKPEAGMTIGTVPAVAVLPMDLVVRGLDGAYFGQELITVGLRESVEKLRECRPTALLAETLLALARASQGYVGLEERLALIAEALRIFRVLDATARLARGYVTLGELMKEAGSFADALQAFRLAESLGLDDAVRLGVEYHRAVICRYVDLPVEALAHLDVARPLVPGEASSEWAQRVLSERALSRLRTADEEGALDDLAEWIAAVGPTHHFPFLLRARILVDREGVEASLDDYSLAAIAAAHEVEVNVSSRFRRLTRQRLSDAFDDSMLAAIGARDVELAYGILSLSRTGARGLGRPGRERDDIDERMLADLRSDAAELVNEATESLQDASRSQAALEERAEWLLTRHELLRSDESVADLDREQLRAAADHIRLELDPGQVVIDLANIPGAVVAFVLTREGLVMEVLDLDPLTGALFAIGVRNELRGGLSTDALTVLAERMLRPLEPRLQDSVTVTFVPTPELAGVPFHLLPVDGRPLVETRIVVSTPAVIRRRAAHRRAGKVPSRAAAWRGLGVGASRFGLPALPGVARELTAAAAHFDDPTVIESPPATAVDLLGIQGQVDVIHIACHADFDPRCPLLSRLVFADRSVFAIEIMLADLDLPLVVLSACETGESSSHAGGHSQSLAAAFLHAGASTVIGAMWPADDDSTVELMGHFYDFLLAGQPAPAALASAQRAMAATGSHAGLWGPFAVFGAASEAQA